MFKKILSKFINGPNIRFYSIVPGLEEIHQPIKANQDNLPNWIKDKIEKSKKAVDRVEVLGENPMGSTFFIEKCPGIRSIISEGIHLKTWQDIKISLVSDDGKFSIHTPTSSNSLVNGHFISPEVQSHSGKQFPEFATSREDSWPHFLKIMSNWRVKMNEDWQLLLLPNYYSNESSLFSAVPGIFDPAFGAHLNINLQFHHRAPFSFIIPAGTSIVKMIPIKKRQNFKIKIDKVTPREVHEENLTLALLKKRFVSSRKDQLKDLAKIRKCPFHF